MMTSPVVTRLGPVLGFFRASFATRCLRCHQKALTLTLTRSLATSSPLRGDYKQTKPTKIGLRADFDLQRQKKDKEDETLQNRHDMYYDLFKDRQSDDKETFHRAIDVYMKHQGVQRRGAVEFIYSSMKRMVEFNVHRDLATYRKLFKVFPEGKMVASNIWQVEWMHYPKQQFCAIDLLDKMESHGVVPDDEFGYMILRTFGKGTHVMRKYQRMMYWMPKFKHINPWPIPKILPEHPAALACLVLRRMAVDPENEILVWHADELEREESADETWVACAQSPAQRDLISAHDPGMPVYVDGPYHVWARYKSLTYFVLRADCTGRWFGQPTGQPESDDLDFEPFYSETYQSLTVAPSVHEQEDGTVLAMSITGTSSKDSLKTWIRLLQRQNPLLADVRVVFRLRTPEHGIQVTDTPQAGVQKT